MALPALVGVTGLSIKLLTGYAVTKVLTSLGMGYVVYKGMDWIMDEIESQIVAHYSQLGDALGILTMMGADTGLAILISAVAVRLGLKGWIGGGLMALRFKNVL